MCTAIAISSLQRLAAFVQKNKDQVIAALYTTRDVWLNKSSWLTIDIGTEEHGRIACRAVTVIDDSSKTGTSTRFCLYIAQDGKLVTGAYVACGFVFREETPPVVVGTLRQHQPLPWSKVSATCVDPVRRIAAQELQLA